MFDILVYLFENYFEVNVYPDEGTLTRELSAAGFDRDEINQAMAWVNGLEKLTQESYLPGLAGSLAQRFYSDTEETKIGTESRGFLSFLETSGILNPVQREWVIDRIMALNEHEVSLEQVKWTVLIVLWSQGQASDFMFIEDLLFGDTQPTMH
jgi:Smg protein